MYYWLPKRKEKLIKLGYQKVNVNGRWHKWDDLKEQPLNFLKRKWAEINEDDKANK